MTEEEANENACCGPVGLAATTALIAAALWHISRGEKMGHVDASANCIGRRCMAWRWRVDKTTNDGYCGLAGHERPE